MYFRNKTSILYPEAVEKNSMIKKEEIDEYTGECVSGGRRWKQKEKEQIGEENGEGRIIMVVVVVVIVMMLMIGLDEKSGKGIGVGIGNGHGRRLGWTDRKKEEEEAAEGESLFVELEISFLAYGSRVLNSGIFTAFCGAEFR